MRHYETFPSAQWPSGQDKPAAQIRFAVGEIENRLGEKFITGNDDLGRFLQMGLRLTSGRLVLLAQYAAMLEEGTIVYIDSQDSVRTAIHETADTLHLDEADFTWISPEPG